MKSFYRNKIIQGIQYVYEITPDAGKDVKGSQAGESQSAGTDGEPFG